MLPILDIALFPTLGLLSIFLIFHFRLKGLIATFLLLWLIPYFWGVAILNQFDPERTSILDQIWLIGGWLPSIVWCLVVFLVKYLIKKNHGRTFNR
ncbi:MAG: hypothetical protein ABII07_02235 [Patescibacteria group bacterium]|nr:hypothetical protein [Patescibacteria group bacterium]